MASLRSTWDAVKEHFFFFICGRFLRFLPSNAPIMLNYDGSSFLKVIDEQNTLHIPKYEGQNIACWCLRLWSLWTAFSCFCPFSWLPIWLLSEVVDPCFIHCHIFMQKLLFVALKQLQTTLWIVDALLFLIDCEQTRPHFEHNFLIDKSSCKKVNTLPSDIFNSSAISCNFNLRCAKTNLWSAFLCFPGQLPNLGDLSVQQHLFLYDHV